jgi:hypothetical protein
MRAQKRYEPPRACAAGAARDRRAGRKQTSRRPGRQRSTGTGSSSYPAAQHPEPGSWKPGPERWPGSGARPTCTALLPSRYTPGWVRTEGVLQFGAQLDLAGSQSPEGVRGALSRRWPATRNGSVSRARHCRSLPLPPLRHQRHRLTLTRSQQPRPHRRRKPPTITEGQGTPSPSYHTTHRHTDRPRMPSELISAETFIAGHNGGDACLS